MIAGDGPAEITALEGLLALIDRQLAEGDLLTHLALHRHIRELTADVSDPLLGQVDAGRRHPAQTVAQGH